MPLERKPSLVYIVKGEGVRNNSWVLQRPFAAPEYSNPPLEQLDSVPTPFGEDLSIRIFDKGTKRLPDTSIPNPNTAVVEAHAEPMVTATNQPSRTTAQPTPDHSPPTRPSVPPKPSVTPPAPSSNSSSAGVLPKPPKTAQRAPSRFSVDERSLRNFRNLSAQVIADPRTMPPPYLLQDSSTPSKNLQLPRTTEKKASEELVQKTTIPTPYTLPKPTPTVSQERTSISPVRPPLVQTPQPPSLALPGPASPPNATAGPSTGVASPSAFGRWKPSSPVLSPSKQNSTQLPSPTKAKTAEKSRLKPWQKSKTGKPVTPSNDGQKKALQDIIDKRMKVRTKSSVTLPPLTNAASHSIPETSKSSTAEALAVDPVLEKISSPKAADQSAQQAMVERDSTPQAPEQPTRHPSKKAASTESIHARKEDAAKARPKSADAVPTSLEKVSPTKATPLVSDLSKSHVPSERVLQQKVSAEPSKPVTTGTPSSAALLPKPREQAATAQPRVIEKASASIKTTRKVSTDQPAEIAGRTSPRTSTDDSQVGTVAHPIITKADLIKARRLREGHGQSKGRSQERPTNRKSSSGTDQSGKEVVSSKPQAGQQPGPEQMQAAKANAVDQTPSLFDSDVQETMKSVIEQVVWTVQHYKRMYGISSHDEMKNNKRRILEFIHVHLDDAASISDHALRAKQQSTHEEREDQDSVKIRQVVPQQAEAGRRANDSRQTNFKSVKANRMFVAWKRDVQTGNPPLAQIASEAEQLRQAVLHCDMRIIHLPANELITRLKELGELSFTFLALKKRLPKNMSDIASINKSREDAKKEEQEKSAATERKEYPHIDFDHVFNIIKCGVLWMFFLEEQVIHTWKSLMESSKARALGFAREVFKVLIKESQQIGGSEGANANKGVIKTVRSLKVVIGRLEDVLNELPDDGKPVSLTIQELVSKFAEICKFGEEKVETKDSTSSSTPVPGAERGTASAVRPDSSIRKVPPTKLNGNQQPRQASDGTPAATSSVENMSRGPAGAQHEASAISLTSKSLTSPRSSPAIPRRPAEPVSPRANQAGPNLRRPASTSNTTRWQNAEKLNLRSLMESARTVHEPKHKGGKLVGSKRKTDEDGERSSAESDGKPAKKRRVRFAPSLVQGAQSTPYSKEALQSLFYDGYDLLGDTTQLQKEAVEERASQMSRGSVIATLGFITSYIGALKAEKEGLYCERPEWVRLPYTAAMKKDIHRFMRHGGDHS